MITAFYYQENIKLYNANCLDLFKALKDQTVDLICADPPYNIGKDFGNDTDKMNLDDYLDLSTSWLEECYRVLSPTGSIIWFGTHLYMAYIQLIMQKIGFVYGRANIWHYENGMSRQINSPVTEYEPFLWMTKSETEWTYNTDDVRVPYKSERVKNPVYKKDSQGKISAWNPHPNGRKRGDVWKYPVLAGKLYEIEKTAHPTQKPEILITNILKAFVPKNDDNKYQGVIFDPFLGSGTTAICAQKLNHLGNHIQFLGCEISEDYCQNIIKPRIQKTTEELEKRLF